MGSSGWRSKLQACVTRGTPVLLREYTGAPDPMLTELLQCKVCWLLAKSHLLATPGRDFAACVSTACARAGCCVCVYVWVCELTRASLLQVPGFSLPASISMAGTLVSMNPAFKLYLHSPTAKPEAAALATLTPVMWETSAAGCESQLLASILHVERPDLAEQHTQLLASMAADQRLVQARLPEPDWPGICAAHPAGHCIGHCRMATNRAAYPGCSPWSCHLAGAPQQESVVVRAGIGVQELEDRALQQLEGTTASLLDDAGLMDSLTGASSAARSAAVSTCLTTCACHSSCCSGRFRKLAGSQGWPHCLDAAHWMESSANTDILVCRAAWLGQQPPRRLWSRAGLRTGPWQLPWQPCTWSWLICPS